MGETPSLTGEFVGENQSPTTYTKPPTWESAPEVPNLLVVEDRVTESQHRAEQAALFPLRPLPNIQCHNTVIWVSIPQQILKALALTT